MAYYDANQGYYDPNQGYYDPNQGYYDPNQGYYDPNQGYYDQNQGYYDPNSYPPYDPVDYDIKEETESAKLAKEQEDQQRLEALESNRLYLKKIRRQCVNEDFADLEQKQLFLFEILLESLEANTESSLGLTSSRDQPYVTARVQFLNSPYLEIYEKDGKPNSSYSPQEGADDYLQIVGEAWKSNYQETASVSKHTGSPTSTTVEPPSSEQILDSLEIDLDWDIKWENTTGKSILFSMSILEMIHNLDRHPVNIEVDRCVGLKEDGGAKEREPLGYASIRLPDEFGVAVLQSMKPGVMMPVTNFYRETCDLRNVFGVKKGRADVLIRLSVFGPVIITSFQSVGGDRKYIFQPTPMASKGVEREHQTPRSELLKPLISEEENAIGITVRTNADIFQKPVIWSIGPQHCGCLEGPCFRMTDVRGSEFDCMSLTKMPYSSDVDLCRDTRPPTDPASLQRFGNYLCDWHNLVSCEVKNDSTGNCGCLDDGDYKCNKRENELLNRLRYGEHARRLPPITGFGIKPEFEGCFCNCPFIREVLNRPPFQN